MRKAAVFIDAGYYYAETAKAKHGRPVARRDVACDHAGLIAALCERIRGELADGEDVRILRCYWYDGAPETKPTAEHRAVGSLTGVKIRLGKLTASGQKGVDGRIILDLLTLAQARAIDTAFVLSGDEDLREAVLEVQQIGVEIVLFGIPPQNQAFNQAETLVIEADRHIVPPTDFWVRFLHDAGPGDQAGTCTEAAGGPDARTVASAFVRQWTQTKTSDDIDAVKAKYPRILPDVDRELLEYAEQTLGNLRREETRRKELRDGFWRAMGCR